MCSWVWVYQYQPTWLEYIWTSFQLLLSTHHCLGRPCHWESNQSVFPVLVWGVRGKMGAHLSWQIKNVKWRLFSARKWGNTMGRQGNAKNGTYRTHPKSTTPDTLWGLEVWTREIFKTSLGDSVPNFDRLFLILFCVNVSFNRDPTGNKSHKQKIIFS